MTVDGRRGRKEEEKESKKEGKKEGGEAEGHLTSVLFLFFLFGFIFILPRLPPSLSLSPPPVPSVVRLSFVCLTVPSLVRYLSPLRDQVVSPSLLFSPAYQPGSPLCSILSFLLDSCCTPMEGIVRPWLLLHSRPDTRQNVNSRRRAPMAAI